MRLLFLEDCHKWWQSSWISWNVNYIYFLHICLIYSITTLCINHLVNIWFFFYFHLNIFYLALLHCYSLCCNLFALSENSFLLSMLIFKKNAILIYIYKCIKILLNLWGFNFSIFPSLFVFLAYTSILAKRNSEGLMDKRNRRNFVKSVLIFNNIYLKVHFTLHKSSNLRQ